MIIKFSPQAGRNYTITSLSKTGDILYINGEEFDFTPMPDNASLPVSAIGSDYFASDVVKSNGVLTITLILPVDQNSTDAAKFPKDITVDTDGPIAVPV